MKKLALKIVEIEVAGFEVVQAESRRGTVNGADAFGITRPTNCNQGTCFQTCFQSCDQAQTCLC